ncbi:MAG: hypothetical protein MAG581_00761 [Deltaproteobacteria bacterium]|jgi:hypothetical protein|nr:hypothetical protein [Deltaproteobacteria bacterium]
MSVSNQKNNDAMARFLVRRYQQTVFVPVLGSDTIPSENTIELIKTHDSDFLG